MHVHEWALAEAVIATVLEESRKERLTEVTELKIKIGELQQIETEIFDFALNELVKLQDDSLLKDMTIKMETERAQFRCRVCGREWTFDDQGEWNEEEREAIHFAPEVAHAYVRCPSCKSPDFEVLQGRGVSIGHIKGIGTGKESKAEHTH
jgi:hydrogenase nickel incorporation protein HypA/HybF